MPVKRLILIALLVAALATSWEMIEPLHQQALASGVADGAEVAQRAHNQFNWTHVVKN